MRKVVFWAAFLACAFFLHFKNLGSTSLWQDEAETAVLARHTLRYGVPKVSDGRNFVSQNLGADHDRRGVWNYSPWLGIYLAAGSFALFGESTFAARLPFALAGVATLLLLYKVAGRWSKDRRTPALTIWLALLSVPYLLHARQCRYYVLDALFALYLYDAYEGLLESRRRAGAHAVIASLALFHSNFLVFFAVLGGILSHFLLSNPQKVLFLRRNAAALATAVALLLPACAYFRILSRAAGEDPHWVLQRWENLLYYLSATDLYLFPALLIPLFFLDRKRLSGLRAPFCFLLGGLGCLVLAPHHFFRYLIPFIPICAFLTAEIFWMVFTRRKEAALGLLGALLFTRALSPSAWTSGALLKTDLPDFIYETTHPIQEPIRAAADYLNERAAPNDLLLVTYPDLPFMFYTHLRVVGGRSGPHPIRPSDSRWVLLRDDAERSDWPLDFRDYEKLPLDAPNWPWGNRPDPDRHVYRAAQTPAPAAIYRRL